MESSITLRFSGSPTQLTIKAAHGEPLQAQRYALRNLKGMKTFAALSILSVNQNLSVKV